jgi:hypothetical protein
VSRVWFAKDADFLEDPAIVELGERHGPGGPLLIDALLGLAKLAQGGGRVTVGHTALARRAFIDNADTVRAILRDSAEFGVLELDEVSPLKCEVIFPQWDRWQTSFRKTRQRERERDTTVTERDTTVTPLSREPKTETKDKQQQKRTPSSVEPVGIDAAAVRDLFAYWQERCDHQQAKFTRDRRSKVEARMREGYTVEEIRAAIDGAAASPFVNPEGKKFDDLELICRNGSKLEDFKSRAEHSAPDTKDFIARMKARRG